MNENEKIKIVPVFDIVFRLSLFDEGAPLSVPSAADVFAAVNLSNVGDALNSALRCPDRKLRLAGASVMLSEVRPVVAFPEKWAKVEIVGHCSHVGRVSEVTIADTPFLRVEALRVDGGYDVVSYGRAAIFSVSPRTEAEARREAVPLAWRPCVLEGGGHDFAPSGALPSACAHCGHDLPEHDKAREKRGAPCSLEGDAPDSDDEIPFPEAKR